MVCVGSEVEEGNKTKGGNGRYCSSLLFFKSSHFIMCVYISVAVCDGEIQGIIFGWMVEYLEKFIDHCKCMHSTCMTKWIVILHCNIDEDHIFYVFLKEKKRNG